MSVGSDCKPEQQHIYTHKVNSNMGFMFSQDFCFPSFPCSQFLDVCQAAQLVKSHPRGMSGNMQRCNEKKRKNRSADCLLASRLCLHYVASFTSPWVCVRLCERVCVCVFPLPDEVTMRDKAAGRACHCQSLFWLLFCFLPKEEKVLHEDQQPLGVMCAACLSVYLCTFPYLQESIFKRLCVCVCVFANICVDVAGFL